jgi:large subunit ribosomal protein L21
MKYAVFASGGKQYKVSEGDVVELEKLKVEAGSNITFDQVLLFAENDIVTVGQPTVFGGSIIAKVVAHTKAPKIRVAKFKAKARYRKVYGHRQDLTKVQIEKIALTGKKVKAETTEEETKAPTAKTTSKK